MRPATGLAERRHPLARAVVEGLLLPDGDALLDLVDEQAARGERVGPVRGGDGARERDVADAEAAGCAE